MLTNMLKLLSQMVKLPFTAFVFSMEMLVKTMQGLQRMADRGVDEIVVGGVQSYEGNSPQSGLPENSARAPSPDVAGAVAAPTNDRASESAPMDRVTTTDKEKRVMDRDLHDDMLKLVRYKVLFVKREYEHAFPEKEDLVSDNMDGSAFTAWKIAEFIQELGRGGTPVPKKWLDKDFPPAEYRENGKLKGLKEDDKKYLRIYYEVLERYPREKFKYEEQQIRVLEEIRDKIPG